MEAREQHFLEAEHQVELRSTGLRKELRLGDLVLAQIVYIIGLQWHGTAGKLGSAHIMFWIPAVLLFYIPSGMVVVHLNREMPLEGGLYQWAKLRFGDLAGFLVALNIWATMILILGSSTSQITDNLAYFIGPSGAWMAESRWATLAVGVVFVGGLMWLARRGMGMAKWLHNAGGFVLFIVLAAMTVLAVPKWWKGAATVAPLAFTPPAVSLLNLNLLGKMGFAAFCGFDGCAIFSAEVRDPEISRTMRRSVWLAAPLIGLFYILGTTCVLAFTRPADIDLIAPASQMLNRGSQMLPFGFLVASIGAGLLICNLIGGSSIYFNAMTRLPMVAGWDHLLPEWMSRLHPRYKTPIGSIVCVGLATLGLTVLGHVGAGAQESFQLLNNAGLICWALTYVVMFAIPLVAPGERPPGGVRIAAVSGLCMTLLFIVLSVFPIIDVANVAAFAARISGVILGINAAGAWYFLRVNRRRWAAQT